MTLPDGALTAQLGSEVAAALSLAIEHVDTLAEAGSFAAPELRALRDAIEHARRLGMLGQQLGRLVAGEVSLVHEPLDLAAVLRELVASHAPEAARRGLELRFEALPATVVTDPSLAFSLLQSLLDWALDHALGPVSLTLERQEWPAEARLACRFPVRPLDRAARSGPVSRLDSVAWRVIEQAARMLALPLARDDDGLFTTVSLDFLRVADALEAAPGAAARIGASPPCAPALADAHVLVIASRRETRLRVRELLCSRTEQIDFVASVEAAQEFCASVLPRVLVFEAAVAGPSLERLRGALRSRRPRLGVVEIAEDGSPFNVREAADGPLASVARDALERTLLDALGWALAR